MIVWRFGLPALSARFPNIKRDTEKKRRKRQRGKGQAQEDNQDGSSPWRCGAAHPGLGRAGRARLIRPRLGCALGKKEGTADPPPLARNGEAAPPKDDPIRAARRQNKARSGRATIGPRQAHGSLAPQGPRPQGPGKPRLGRRAKLAALSQARRGALMGWPGWSPAGCRLRRPLRSRRFLALRLRIRPGADSVRSRRGRLRRASLRRRLARRFAAAAAGC